MNISLLMVAVLVFCAAFLFVLGCWMMLRGPGESGGDRLKERMDDLARMRQDDMPVSLYRKQVISPTDRVLLTLAPMRALDRMMVQGGQPYGPTGALLRMLGTATALALPVALFVGRGPFLVVIVALAGMGGWWLYWTRTRRDRRDKMVRQLPDAMDFFARSLRAGNPFIAAMRAAPDEMQQPLARELEIAFEEMNYGLDFQDVMQNLANRIDAEEVRFFVTAVLVQKTTGGNLAEILNRIAGLLRQRQRTKGEVQVQAAEMKTSAHVLIALPFAVAGILQLINPEYFPVMLESPMGRGLIYAQVTLMAIGYMIIRKMVNFRI